MCARSAYEIINYKLQLDTAVDNRKGKIVLEFYGHILVLLQESAEPNSGKMLPHIFRHAHMNSIPAAVNQRVIFGY